MPERLRVVIDPNVWVSALINPYGVPARVVEAVMTGQLVAVVTQPLLDELRAVLMRPKFRRWISTAAATALVDALAREADVHPDPGAPRRRLRDPDDEYLVALAEQAGATIVTGDRDLLEAGLDQPVITPSGLLALLTSRG